MTVCPFRHVRTLMFESRASLVVDSLGVKHSSISTTQTSYEESLCEQKRNCDVCDRFITSKKHECFKPYCKNCDQNKVGHFCYMKPLKNELPRCEGVLFVFYDFETTQDTKFSDKANVHIPMLVCLQQF